MRGRYVADTGPLRYLVILGLEQLLPRLCGDVVAPRTVLEELLHPSAPEPVRLFAASPPEWLTAVDAPDGVLRPAISRKLDKGERAAIALAVATGAVAVLTDDRAASAAARDLGFEVFGTLGVLDRAAARGWIDLPVAVALLRRTNFRAPAELLDTLLLRDRARQNARP